MPVWPKNFDFNSDRQRNRVEDPTLRDLTGYMVHPHKYRQFVVGFMTTVEHPELRRPVVVRINGREELEVLVSARDMEGKEPFLVVKIKAKIEHVLRPESVGDGVTLHLLGRFAKYSYSKQDFKTFLEQPVPESLDPNPLNWPRRNGRRDNPVVIQDDEPATPTRRLRAITIDDTDNENPTPVRRYPSVVEIPSDDESVYLDAEEEV
ncbi:hypothetical protein KCU71_g2202, partial [Aureobasidium melanogenum]